MEQQNNFEKFGTPETWAQELGISSTTILKRFNGERGITGIDAHGRLIQDGFFAEDDVRSRCEDLIDDLPIADETGFIVIGGERYAPLNVWCRTIPMSREMARPRCTHIKGVKAREWKRRIFNFLPESEVRRACADFLPEQK